MQYNRVTMTPSTAEERREIILARALDLIADQGLDGVSMASLARAAGVSRPAIYQYFASREHILGELLINDMADLSNEIDRLLASIDDPLEQIRVWMHYSLTHMASDEHRVVREISAQHLPLEQRGELKAMHGYFMSSLLTPLSHLGVSDPASVCHMIFGVVNSASKRIEQGANFAAEASTLEKFVIAGIEAAL